MAQQAKQASKQASSEAKQSKAKHTECRLMNIQEYLTSEMKKKKKRRVGYLGT